MSNDNNNSTNVNEDSTSGMMTFTQYNLPALESGTYTIKVAQNVYVSDTQEASYTQSQQFYVAGERFSLAGTDINSVFPPNGSQGSYDSILPHVILNSATLPWQRELPTSDPELTNQTNPEGVQEA